jgi:hypothetical protein
MLFSGRDLWRNGAFAYGGFVLAPGGIEQDGLLLKVLLSGGVYRTPQKISGACAWLAWSGLHKCYRVGGSKTRNSSFTWGLSFRNSNVKRSKRMSLLENVAFSG